MQKNHECAVTCATSESRVKRSFSYAERCKQRTIVKSCRVRKNIQFFAKQSNQRSISEKLAQRQILVFHQFLDERRLSEGFSRITLALCGNVPIAEVKAWRVQWNGGDSEQNSTGRCRVTCVATGCVRFRLRFRT